MTPPRRWSQSRGVSTWVRDPTVQRFSDSCQNFFFLPHDFLASPKFFEGLFCDAAEAREFCPAIGWIEASAFDQRMKYLREAPDSFGKRIKRRPIHDEGEHLECRLSPATDGFCWRRRCGGFAADDDARLIFTGQVSVQAPQSELA